MKLHLPKLLIVALAAAYVNVAHAAEPSYTTDSKNNKLYNVGQHTGNSAPSSSNNMWVCEGDLELLNSDKLGIVEGEGLYMGATTGQVLESYNWLGQKESSSTGKVSKNVKINGTLTIKDTAQVVLGGQHKTSGFLSIGSVDEYTGIIADKILVQGGKDENGKYVTNLNVWNASVGVLEVDSGNVSIHTNGNGSKGNTSIIVKDPVDSKQVRIKTELKVNGGNVTIGSSSKTANRDADDTQCQVGFGNGTINENNPAASTITSSWIYQGTKKDSTGGNLTVAGKSVSVGGLNIVQDAGNMSISDGFYHIIADNGITADSSVTQNGSGTLTIGGVLAENKYKDKVKEYTGFGDAEFHVTQNGSGTISMTNGIVFNYNSDATAKSSFEQNGSGVINLSGVFGRNDATTAEKWAAVYFDVTQNGKDGKIILKDGTSFSAGNIEQTNAGTLSLEGSAQMTAQSICQSNGGTITVSEQASLNADSLDAGVITVTETTEGDKTIKNVEGSIQADGNVSLSNGTLRTEGEVVACNGAMKADSVSIHSGSIVMSENGTLNANTLNVTSGVARSATSAVTGSNVTLSGGSLSTEGSTVTNTGSLAASELTINSGTFVNKGTLSAADAQAIAALASEEDAGLALLGASAGFTITVGPNGTFENSGQAWCDILVDGGTLTLGAGSENYEITMNSGTIDVQGDITSGSLTLNGGTINFADGATVTLADDATLNISEDTTIMVTVTPEMLENLEGMEFELFSGNASNLTSANIVFTDGDDDHSNDMSAEVTTGSSSGSIKVESSEVVPEPTTATLSLLALCGLAMRRRRK